MTTLLERLPGRPGEVAEAVGAVLARLHAGADAGADAGGLRSRSDAGAGALGSEGLLALVAARAAAGQLRPELLPPPYRRYSVNELITLAGDGAKMASDRPETEPVPVHGDPRLEHLVVEDGDGARVVGHIAAAGLGDRHLDLAIAHQSVHRHLGAEAVMAFYHGYGRDPDLVALDHYILISLLLGRGEPADAPDR